MTVVVLARSLRTLATVPRPDGTDAVVFTADPVGLDSAAAELAGTDVRYVADFATSATVELNIVAFAQRKPITAIWATDPRDAVRAGALRDYLGIPGQGRDSALIFADLTTQRATLGAAGIPVVPSIEVRMAADVYRAAGEWGLPLRIRRRRAPGWPEVARLDANTDVVSFTAAPLCAQPGGVPSLLAETPVAGLRHRVAADGTAAAEPVRRTAARVAAALPVPPGARLTVELIVAGDGAAIVDSAEVEW